MENLSVGGLASGLDTNSIIDGLVKIERSRVSREEAKKRSYDLKLSTFGDLQTRLQEFDKKAGDLDNVKAFNLYTSTTSDETLAKISGGTDATPGNYDIKTVSLATSLKVASDAYATQTTALGVAGKFTISKSAAALEADPTTSTVEIEITAGDALKDVAAKINRAKGAGATASVIKLADGDFRLMLNAVDQGTEAFKLTETTGTPLGPAGLKLVNYKESLRSDFELRLAAGGPATTATTLNQLFTGTSGGALTAGDQFILDAVDNENAFGEAISGSFTVTNPATDSVASLLAAIKTAFDNGGTRDTTVSLNSSGEIVLKDNSGTASTGLGTDEFKFKLRFSDADASGSSIQLGAGSVKNDFKNVLADGKKAFYLLNDISIASQSNKDESTLQGTTIELLKADPTTTVKLSLERDKDGIRKRVEEFTSTYNQLLQFIDQKMKVETKDEKDKDQNDIQSLLDGDKKSSAAKKGPFAGDSSLLGMKNQIRSLMTSSIAELKDSGLSKYTSLSSIGITSDSKTGLLSIDEDKFEEALDTDFEGVRRLFVTGGYSTNSNHTLGYTTKDAKTGIYNIDPAVNEIDDTQEPVSSTNPHTATRAGDTLKATAGRANGLSVVAASGSGTGTFTFVRGIAGQIANYYDKISDSVDGFLRNTREGIQKKIDQTDKKISEMEDRVETYRKKLVNQFSGLEQNISRLQAQSSAFQGQIGGLMRR